MQTCNDFYINGFIHEDVVKSVKSKLPPEKPILSVSGLFRVLGEDTRMRIICALGISEMCVCDIAALLNMSSSAISHQLRILKESKIIKSRREGKAVYYVLADEHIEKLYKIAFEHVTEV